MKYTLFETNANGSEKYSRVETVEAASCQEAAARYQAGFELALQASHLMVTTAEGVEELIVVRGSSPPPVFATGFHTPSPAGSSTTPALEWSRRRHQDVQPWRRPHRQTVDDKSRRPVTRETTNSVAEESCGWSTFCWVIGWMNLFLGGVGLLMMLLAGSKDGLVLLISGVAGGLSTLIFGYIIQLLFDCRRYLRRMTER